MFSSVPKDWTVAELRYFLDWITYGFTNPMPTTERGPSKLTAKNIEDGKIAYSSARHTSKEAFDRLTNKSKPRINDVLLTKDGTLGRVAVVDRSDMCINQSIALLRSNERINPYFLKYLLQAPYYQNKMEMDASGTTIKHIYITKVDKMEVAVPPIEVQRKIVGILKSYDGLIEIILRCIQILEEIATNIYNEWFVHFRYPEFENTETISTRYRPVPKGWEIRTLSEVCEVIKSGGTPSRKETSYWKNGTIEWFKTKELDDSFLYSSEEKITEKGLRNSSARLFDAGTILMAIYAAPTVGRLGILTVKSSCNQAALGLKADAKYLTQHFLFFTLKNLRDYFNSISSGVAQQNISAMKVKEAEFLLPEYPLIEKFDAIVKPIMSQVRLLNQQKSVLRQCREMLLPKLISGHVDVSGLDILGG